MKRLFIIFLVIISVASIAYAAVSMKKMSAMDAEIASLKVEKIALLSEHEECLEYKEQSLRKELVSKYLDSMMALAKKSGEGYKPTEKELSDFYDRFDFITKNIQSVAVSKEEAALVMTFIDSAKKELEANTGAENGKGSK